MIGKILKNLSLYFIFIFLFTFFLTIILKYVLKKMKKIFKENEKNLNYVIIKAIEKPLFFLIWAITSDKIFEKIIKSFENKKFDKTQYITKVLIIIIVTWLIIRILRSVTLHFQDLALEKPEKNKIENGLLTGVSRLIEISILILATLTILEIFSIPIGALMAFGGMGALGISFAAKDALSNFFGGFLLYLDRPFAIGDWIYTTDQEVEGTVEYIGWRLTQIRTFEKRKVFIPNSYFSTRPIVNATRMSNRRIKQYIGLRFEDADKIKKVLENIKKMLKSHPDIDTRQIILVNLVNGSEHGGTYGAYSIKLKVYAYTKTKVWEKFQNLQDEIMIEIYEIIKKCGADIAFPTSTLHIKSYEKGDKSENIDNKRKSKGK